MFKKHTIIICETNMTVDIFAISTVTQLITVRDNTSHEILCENLIMHATQLAQNTASKNVLCNFELEIIRRAVEKELFNYRSWDIIPASN